MHFGPKIATDGCVASIDGSDNGSFEVLIVAGGGGGGMDMGGGWRCIVLSGHAT